MSASPPPQPSSLPITPIRLDRAFANELFALFAKFLVPLPASMLLQPHPYLPILFPLNVSHAATNYFAFAITDSVALHFVTAISWKHVVVKTPRHVLNILARPFSPVTSSIYSATRRLDIFLPPPSDPIPNYSLFLSPFSRLTTLIWTFPPRSFFYPSSPTAIAPLTHLQIGNFPPDTCALGLRNLALTFPNLEVLQIVACNALLDMPDNFAHPTPHKPAWPSLKHLALGVACNFIPGTISTTDNNFMNLCGLFVQDSLFPNLQILHTEIFVTGIEPFLSEHANSISTASFPSSTRDYLLDTALLAIPPSLATIILHVDSFIQDFDLLPANITDVVVVQPLVPAWVDTPNLRYHVVQCLKQILATPDHAVRRIQCENRNLFTGQALTSTLALFKGSAIEFSLFDFGIIFFRLSGLQFMLTSVLDAELVSEIIESL